MPLFMGMGVGASWTVAAVSQAMPSLMGHLIFGSRSLLVRPRERRELSRASFNDRHKNTQSDTAGCEDVAQGPSRAHQTSLHSWRPGFVPKPQRAVRSDEIVVATHELDVAAELVFATGVAGRAPTQGRRRLPNREVEALDERGVQGLGILRPQQRGLQPIRRADLHAALDPDDTIIPPSLEHLTIDAR